MSILEEGSFLWDYYVVRAIDANSDFAKNWWKRNANVRDCHGWTALHHATINGNTVFAKDLVELGCVDMYAQTSVGKSNVLHLAVENGSVECLQFFWKHGPQFKLDCKNKAGDTVLHLAARYYMVERNRRCFDFLMATGKANMNLQNGNRDYVLDIMISKQFPYSVLHPFVLGGARFHYYCQDGSDMTRAQLACVRKSLRACRLASRATARALMHCRILHKDVIPLIVAEIEKTRENTEIWVK